jgi:Protein kinase domain/PEGA domain
VGRYQLLEPVGIGPSGTVSRAKVFGVAGFERQFAVKRFHNELTTNPALAAALSTAARGYGSLEHPRIARMSEFGVAQGTTFTAVEFVSGLDALRLIAEARLAGTSLAAGGALALVSQAARAVGYAHGRGLTHLGLAPTNVIVTADGDIKITDFGILAAALPPKPTDSQRLAHRIQYLSPEQLANEATSAATDVFALGVLAFELVTGQRTFKGDTAAQIAQSVMAGPPSEPPLPRPIVRVLQRCLARSPFERFPDARALADALDAALRVAPVPGTRKDIGAQVQSTLERISAMNEGALSGMLALDIGTGPIPTVRSSPASEVPALGRGDPGRESDIDMSTLEFVRPDTAVAGPTPLVGPASLANASATNTFPEMVKPFTTVPGLAPPPIPVPQGISNTPTLAPHVGPGTLTPPAGIGTSTLLGIQNAKAPPAIPLGKLGTPPRKPGAIPPIPPPIPPRPSTNPLNPIARPPTNPLERPSTNPLARPSSEGGPPPIPPRTERPSALMRAIEEADVIEPSAVTIPLPALEEDDGVPSPRTTDPGLGVFENSAAHRLETSEMAPEMADAYAEASLKETHEIEPFVQPAIWEPRPETESESFEPANEVTREVNPRSSSPRAPTPIPLPMASMPMPQQSPMLSPQSPQLRPPMSAPLPIPLANTPYPLASPAHSMTTRTRPAPGRSRAPWIVAGALGVAVLGLGGWWAYNEYVAPESSSGSTKVVTPTSPKDAASAPLDATAVAATADAATTDATAVAMATDAAVAMTTDAAVAMITDAAPLDAAVAASPRDAGPADASTVAATVDAGAKPAVDGQLAITSTPARARVFLDGADVGTTPLKLPGTPDRHTIAVLMSGHELYVAQVDGQGAFEIPLKEVTPSGGPAGIKVIRCKDKDRYYVFVDGKATGMTCPTERIEVQLGPHTVEVYDVVSDSRRKFDIDVKDTRLSVRVKVE